MASRQRIFRLTRKLPEKRDQGALKSATFCRFLLLVHPARSSFDKQLTLTKGNIMSGKWTAQVQVKWNKDAPVAENWDWLKKWKEVKWAASTMGDWDMVLWVDVQTPAELEKFVHEKLRAKKWVADTRSTWTKEVWKKAA